MLLFYNDIEISIQQGADRTIEHHFLRYSATAVVPISMRVFLDTEFTNFDCPSLISIGLVSELGAEFYAEVPFPLSECSDFVVEVVLPLLNGGDSCIRSHVQLKDSLSSWLASSKNNDKQLVVLYDSQTDWDLFARALDFRIPSWCHPQFVVSCLDECSRSEFDDTNELTEHHALDDARTGLFRFLSSKG